jgi:hypothetical protein
MFYIFVFKYELQNVGLNVCLDIETCCSKVSIIPANQLKKIATRGKENHRFFPTKDKRGVVAKMEEGSFQFL